MKPFYTAFALLFLSLAAIAQKTPDIQSSALSAPDKIRIDGKANEWGDSFAADNKRTSLLYSLANDDKNLYLVIKAISLTTINKIMAGGITFNVNVSGKKREDGSLGITYPLIKRATRNQAGRGQGRGNFGAAAQNSTQRDSAALAQHKTELTGAKEIKIIGFKNITDSLISIYNEYGIKAVASLDNKGAMVYELAIPLNLLELATEKPKEFVYQIKVNGLVMRGFGGGGGGRPAGFGGARGGGNNNSNAQDLLSPTDFWGKYTLIKK
ncbi:MAG: hypothetical protein V4541_10285 [Bacteroidota bacterium]